MPPIRPKLLRPAVPTPALGTADLVHPIRRRALDNARKCRVGRAFLTGATG